MRKIIFIICLGIFASKDGTAFYENLYTDTIYDQTDLSEPYTKEQAIDLLNQQKSKMIKEIILPQLRQELSEKQSVLYYFHWKRFFISAAIQIIHALSFTETGYSVDCFDNMKRNKEKRLEETVPVVALEANIIAIEDYIKNLESNGIQDKVYPLECDYVAKKYLFPILWQQKIESQLLSLYNLAEDEERYIKKQNIIKIMLNFSFKTQTLVNPYDETQYFQKLEEATTNLTASLLSKNWHDQTQEILTHIAECHQHSIDKNTEENTRHFSYIQHKSEDSEIEKGVISIANALKVPFYIIDASKFDNGDESLLGNVDKPGEVLNAFIKHSFHWDSKFKLTFINFIYIYALKHNIKLPQQIVNVGDFNNPILIIKNIDHWVNHEDIPFILKIFDQTAKTFHSPYLDMDIDISKMSVIALGETPIDQLSTAFQSRVTGFSY
ncbi:MAG: hypothetical protein Q8S31_00820 [Alphaproteobacteria bacterium]|nr:hypothetical protein [Alphaproteobacteria bacterium]